MSFETALALVIFAFLSVATPGPNNVMLMASGLNFGWQRSIPHMVGVALGVPIMLLVLGFGLMRVFEAYPIIRQALTIACTAYLLYLAWKIANAAPASKGETGGKPLTFLQAAAFQWVNPKAWTMVMTALTLYVPADLVRSGPWIAALAFASCAVVSTNTWVLLGTQIRRVLKNPTALKIFNWACAAALVATLYPVFF